MVTGKGIGSNTSILANVNISENRAIRMSPVDLIYTVYDTYIPPKDIFFKAVNMTFNKYSLQLNQSLVTMHLCSVIFFRC